MPPVAEFLADLSDSGSPVASRISDPEHAYRIVQRLISDDRERARRRVKVQGQIDGNAPVSSKKLSDAGREGDSNLNWREAKGHILNAWTPYFDLTVEVPVCIDGDLEYASSEQDAALMRGFAEYFHDMVFQWRGFDRVEQMRDWQMLVHGAGLLAWEDEFDWRPKAILVGDFYLPDETDSDLENCEQAAITTAVSAGYLYRKIENEKQAAAAGWEPKAVKEAIMSSARSGSPAYGWQWDKWQQALKNGDLYVNQKLTKRISLATLLVKEMDGSISQHIVQYGSQASEGSVKFLFSKVSRFENWDQCVQTFPYDVGSDGSYHSVKGLGTEIYPYCELSNRLKNETATVVLTGIRPMFQAKTGAASETLQMIRLGSGNVLPPNLDITPLNVQGAIAPALEVSREMQNTLMQNTGTYRQTISQPTVERTAKEVTITAMDQAKLTKGAHNRFYRCKDRQYAEMWRRAVNPKLREGIHPGAKEALKFQERCHTLCDKLGVPHEALQKVENVRAYRSMGLGSAAMRVEIANSFMQNIDRFDEIGKNEILRMWVATMTSFHAVDAIVPSLTAGRDNTNDDSVAAQENNAFSILGMQAEAKVTPGQDHVIHLTNHVASMENDVKMLEQGAIDPREAFMRVEAKGAHSHEHQAVLQSNPTRQREAAAFGERLRVLASMQDKLQQNIEAQDAANPQPQQGQPDPALVKVEGQLALKDKKQTGDHELKVSKTQADLGLRKERQDAELAMQADRHNLEKSLADAETADAIARKNAVGNSAPR